MKFKTEGENLRQFQNVIKNAFKQAKAAGSIPSADLPACEKAVTELYTLHGQKGSLLWRRLRRRVAAKYWRSQGRSIRGTLDWQIDWEAVLAWIMENIVPILKMILTLLPLFLSNESKR